MVTVCSPIFVSSNFNIIDFVCNVSGCKTVVNVVRFVLIALQKESWMFFFTLFSIVMLVIYAVNFAVGKFSNHIRMITNSILVIPNFVAVEVAN